MLPRRLAPLLALGLAACGFSPTGQPPDGSAGADGAGDGPTDTDAGGPVDAGQPDAAGPIDAAGPDASTCIPTTEVCNGVDDDCDGMADEDFDLTSAHDHCGACGTVCADTNATNACVASVCVPACAAGARDCDSDPTNGCELRDDDPVCTAVSATPAFTVRGDVGNDTMTVTGFGEQFIRVRVAEADDGTLTPVTASVALTSPANADFDLYVQCASCAGPVQSATTTAEDRVNMGRRDINGGDASFDLIIEVRYYSAATCAPWSLTVTGHVATADRTCN
ncbi:MAG: hypothetical protein R3B06_07175 [Kofleriaceae bacterium]